MTEPKKGWFQRLSDGLAKSSKQITETVVGGLVKEPLDQAALEAWRSKSPLSMNSARTSWS